MKIPNVSPKWKWFIGMVIYCLCVYACTLPDDYRRGFWMFMILCGVGFGMALWTMINKKVIALILAGSIAFAPIRSGSGELPIEQPHPQASVIWACGVLIIGGIIVWSLWKLCKKLPTVPKHPGNPPGTNNPPDELVSPVTPHALPPLIMPDTDITASPTEYETMALQFQKSEDGGQTWQTAYTCTNWAGPTYVFSVIYSNGIPLKTNQCSVSWTNETMILDFSSVMEQVIPEGSAIWRAVQVQ